MEAIDEVELCLQITAKVVKELREAGLEPRHCLLVAAGLIVGCSREGEAIRVATEVMPKAIRDIEKGMAREPPKDQQ